VCLLFSKQIKKKINYFKDLVNPLYSKAKLTFILVNLIRLNMFRYGIITYLFFRIILHIHLKIR